MASSGSNNRAEPTPRAEAVVATVGDAISEGLASKADIAEVRTELKAVIAEVKAETVALRTELKADIAEVKTDVARLETRIEASARRNLLAMIAVGGLIVAALKLL